MTADYNGWIDLPEAEREALDEADEQDDIGTLRAFEDTEIRPPRGQGAAAHAGPVPGSAMAHESRRPESRSPEVTKAVCPSTKYCCSACF